MTYFIFFPPGNHGVASRACITEPILGIMWTAPQINVCGEFDNAEAQDLAVVYLISWKSLMGLHVAMIIPKTRHFGEKDIWTVEGAIYHKVTNTYFSSK